MEKIPPAGTPFPGGKWVTSPSRSRATPPEPNPIHRLPSRAARRDRTAAPWGCSRLGSYGVKRRPSNRYRPASVPSHRYPSCVWAMARTGPGMPSFPDQAVCVNCETDFWGSSACSGAANANVNVRQARPARLPVREGHASEDNPRSPMRTLYASKRFRTAPAGEPGRLPQEVKIMARAFHSEIQHAPAHLRGLLRHFADLREGTHGDGAVTRADKERLFASAVGSLDRYARPALAELNHALPLGTGTIA